MARRIIVKPLSHLPIEQREVELFATLHVTIALTFVDRHVEGVGPYVTIKRTHARRSRRPP